MSKKTNTYTSDATITMLPHLLNGGFAFDAYGGRGAGNPDDPNFGPLGGGSRVYGSISAASGDQFDIKIGKAGFINAGGVGYQAGGNSGGSGFQGGGGGGGSTAISVHSSVTPLVIAAGGGGAGGAGSGLSNGGGGIGGQGGFPGANGSPGTGFGVPGGGNGANWAGPGTGGAGFSGGGNGATGSSTAGGVGGTGSTEGGGGGGGGLYGGGGGGGYSSSLGPSGGGGGGGTSWWANTVINPQYITGAGWADGKVTIVQTVADPPLAPSLVSPVPGARLDSNALGVTFDWTYNKGTDSGGQTAWALRIKQDSGAYQYWNAGTSALQAGIIWNTSTATILTIAAAILADGHTYNWSVATQEGSFSLQGPFAPDQTFQAVALPTPVITGPTGFTTAPNPMVTWTETLGGGLFQTNFRVIIYSLAQTLAPGFAPGSVPNLADSGLQTSAALFWGAPSNAIPNGTSCVAYLQIVETGGISSAWVSSAFTVNFGAPNNPDLSAVPSVDTASGCPIIALSVQGQDNLLSAADASFVGTIGGWAEASGPATVASSVIQPFGNPFTVWCLEWLSTGAGAAIATSTPGTGGFPVTPGQLYSSSVKSWPGANVPVFGVAPTLRTFQAGIAWYDSSGTLLSRSFGSSFTEVFGTSYTDAVLVGATAPAGAAFGSTCVQMTLAAPLTTPTGVTVTPFGTTGATTYTYRVTAINAYGESLGSIAASTATGNATLSGVNTNHISWSAVTGAAGYKIYRTVGGATTGVIAQVGSGTGTLVDTGLLGTGTVPPVVNSSGESHSIIAAAAYIGSFNGWSAGGFIGASTVEIQMSLDQVTWFQVRKAGAIAMDLNQFAQTFDAEAPFGVPLYYRARLSGTISSQLVSGPWSFTATTFLTSKQWWLQVRDLDLTYSLALHRAAPATTASSPGFPTPSQEFDETEEQGIFWPPGSDTAIVVRGAVRKEAFILTMTFDGADEYAQFVKIRQAQKTVVLRSDMPGQRYYVSLGADRPALLAHAADRIVNPLWQVAIACTPVDSELVVSSL